MEEVKPIAEDLKYRLKLQKVSLQDFEKVLKMINSKNLRVIINFILL